MYCYCRCNFFITVQYIQDKHNNFKLIVKNKKTEKENKRKRRRRKKMHESQLRKNLTTSFYE